MDQRRPKTAKHYGQHNESHRGSAGVQHFAPGRPGRRGVRAGRYGHDRLGGDLSPAASACLGDLDRPAGAGDSRVGWHHRRDAGIRRPGADDASEHGLADVAALVDGFDVRRVADRTVLPGAPRRAGARLSHCDGSENRPGDGADSHARAACLVVGPPAQEAQGRRHSSRQFGLDAHPTDVPLTGRQGPHGRGHGHRGPPVQVGCPSRRVGGGSASADRDARLAQYASDGPSRESRAADTRRPDPPSQGDGSFGRGHRDRPGRYLGPGRRGRQDPAGPEAGHGRPQDHGSRRDRRGHRLCQGPPRGHRRRRVGRAIRRPAGQDQRRPCRDGKGPANGRTSGRRA